MDDNIPPMSVTSSSNYCIVKFKEDQKTHVCSEADIKYKKYQSRIRTFAKYSDGQSYHCTLLSEDSSKETLILEKKAHDKRAEVHNPRGAKKRTRNSQLYYLVRFVITKDFFIYCKEELLTCNLRQNEVEDGIRLVEQSNGLLMKVQIIAKGVFNVMWSQLQKIRSFMNSSTPVKTHLQNPLIKDCRVEVVKNYGFKNHTRTGEASKLILPTTVDELFEITDSPLLLSTSQKQYEVSHETENVSIFHSTPQKQHMLPFFESNDGQCFDDHVDESEEDPYSASDDNDPDYVESPLPSDYEESIMTPLMHSILDESSNSLEVVIFNNEVGSKENENCPSAFNIAEHPRSSCQLPESFASLNDSYQLIEPFASPETSDISIQDLNTVNNFCHVSEPFGSPETSPVKFQDLDIPNDPLQASQKKSSKSKRLEAACLFCNKLIQRVDRHILTVHKNTTEVRNLLALDLDQRKKRLAEMRKEGTFRHNCKVRETKDGKFITPRRPVNKEKVNPENYLPCPSCKLDVKKTGLSNHIKRCNTQHKRYDRIQSVASLQLPESIVALNPRMDGFKILWENVFPQMNADHVRKVVMADELIVMYGGNYCAVNLKRIHKKRHLIRVVSQNMRRLGRLLITIRNMYGSEYTLQDFLHPSKFLDLSEAVLSVAGYKNDDLAEYSSPSLTVALGHLLKHCAKILKSKATMALDEAQKKTAKSFLELYETDWLRVTTAAYEQLREGKFRKKCIRILPLAEDILIFNKYLKDQELVLRAQLEIEFTYEIWLEFGKILLCSLILFNRKRVGDVQSITIENYTAKCTAQSGSQIYDLLDPVDRMVASSFVHFFTRGKKASQVPMMIPVRQLPSFELFVKYRKQAEIKETNPFLFGKPNGRCLDGCAALRVLSKKSGAKEHHLLRSTLLRKHIATMSQVLHLENGQLDILAQYMGHSLEVHREFYRLPDQALHLAKMSKLLMAVSTDNVEALRVKSLDALPVPSEESTVEYLMPIEDMNPEDLEDNDNQDIDYVDPENVCGIYDVPASSTRKKEKTQNKAASVTKNDEVLNKRNKILPSKKKQMVGIPWTPAERKAIFQHFAHNIQVGIPVGKNAAEEVKAKESVLKHRHWKNIKDYVRNASRTKKTKNIAQLNCTTTTSRGK